MRHVVASKGFHGASMGAVAAAAGVATGTAYVYYASKDELIVATYVETKRELGDSAVAHPVDGDALERAAAASDLVAVLVDLPPLLLYDLALGPVVRIAASERRPEPAEIAEIIESCWRAVTR